MRNFYVFFLAFGLIGCTNFILNATFQSRGVFSDTVEIVKTENRSEEVVFIPMKHLGTHNFYNNVKIMVDSLSAVGYIFYVETIKSDSTMDTEFRKFRKITGRPIAGYGYKYLLDSVMGEKYNIKLKKELIDQPRYRKLGVDSLNGKHVDASLDQMINYYENKYGEIILFDCDFESKVTEESSCKDKKMKKEIKDDLILDFRNEIVLKEIDSETNEKIAIIYGENHMTGILEGLKARGYKVVGEPPE